MKENLSQHIPDSARLASIARSSRFSPDYTEGLYKKLGTVEAVEAVMTIGTLGRYGDERVTAYQRKKEKARIETIIDLHDQHAIPFSILHKMCLVDRHIDSTCNLQYAAQLVILWNLLDEEKRNKHMTEVIDGFLLHDLFTELVHENKQYYQRALDGLLKRAETKPDIKGSALALSVWSEVEEVIRQKNHDIE